MGRALLQEALVVARRMLGPPGISVIGALIRQNENLLVKRNHRVIVVCHAGSLMAEGDFLWRPPGSDVGPPERYPGPPAADPPQPGWHPQFREATAPPRPLPQLDHNAIDLAEQRAARVTYAIGAAALAVLVLLACWRVF